MNKNILINTFATFVLITIIGVILYCINVDSAIKSEWGHRIGSDTSPYTTFGIKAVFIYPSILIGILCLLYCVAVLLPARAACSKLQAMKKPLPYFIAWAGIGLLAAAILLFSIEPIIAMNSVPYGIRSDFNKIFELLGYSWVNFVVYFTTITGAVVFAFVDRKSYANNQSSPE